MRLAREAFDQVFAALCDAFSTADLPGLARCLNVRVGDVAGANARDPDVVRALIEHAEDTDAVPAFVTCAQGRNAANLLLAALDGSNLQAAPAPRQVVETGEGTQPFKARLIEALAGLGTAGMEALAGHELSSLLGGATAAETETVYLALVGTARTATSDLALAALTAALAAALRQRAGGGPRPAGVEVDLNRTHLRRIDLSGVDLHEADLAFADLRHADLTKANLWRSRAYAVDVSEASLGGSNVEEVRWHECRGREARFHNCRMVSAFFKDADLAGAEFQGSRLQGAHFDRADLAGADFAGANLADAFFPDATIDEAAARSMAKADNWQRAHLDPAAFDLVARAAAP